MLSEFYVGQLEGGIATDLARVRTAADHVEATLHDGTCIRDNGALIEASDMSDAAARTMIAMAAAHGWTRIEIAGDEGAKAAMWLAAQRRGIEVTNWQPPDAVQAAWEREEVKRKRKIDGEVAVRDKPRLSLRQILTRAPVVERLDPRNSASSVALPVAPVPGASLDQRDPKSSDTGHSERPHHLPVIDVRALEVLGQARAEELARRRKGPSTRRIPSAPGRDAAPADQAAWVGAMNRQIRDARGRLAKIGADAPLQTLEDARERLIADADATLAQAKHEARAASRTLTEHQTARPGRIFKWLSLAGAAQWQLEAEVLAQQHGTAAAALNDATLARRDRARYLASPAGKVEIQAALDRSRLTTELTQLRKRDLATEIRELEHRVQAAQQDWGAPSLDLKPTSRTPPRVR
ncbi:LPD7 domain-containing protein [Muricoccus nepalensis]|uniref:LPD7 domain-containing protein n=1 Tax=Muricoccus nepalensis TaxID=1854500 RepID=UPI0011288439|nr:LPD7 domain-containing protein [Roseomonas nepalensis]